MTLTRVSHDSGTLPQASGLKDNWKAKTKTHAPDEPAIGGLTDKHVFAVKPKTSKGVPRAVVGVCPMFALHLGSHLLSFSSSKIASEVTEPVDDGGSAKPSNSKRGRGHGGQNEVFIYYLCSYLWIKEL
jgi:hypothetical protein